jgi:succinate-acetate transporter protein
MTARQPLYWLGWLGTALLTLTVFALLLDIPGTVDKTRIVRAATLVGLLALSSTAYFAAVRLVLRHTWPRGTLWAVLGLPRTQASSAASP